MAALSLGRVVDSSRYVLPVLGAALLPHAIGALFRRRNWSVWVGVAATLVGLVVFIVLALEPSTTTFGLPGADTWHVLDRQLTNGWHLLRTAPAPAPATDGAILLAVIAVWCMAAVADWVAFGRQATLGAIAPALVFFVWTSTLGTNGARVPVTAAFCVAAGAFLLAQNVAVLDHRRSWLVSQHAARPHWLVPASALGAAAIVFALLVAPIIPGVGGDPLLDVSNPGRNDSAGRSYRPGSAPFVDIRAKLDQTGNEELFTVASPQPDYWRIAALDQYSGDNGGQWTLSAEGDGSVGVGLPPVSGAPKGTLHQQFRIGVLTERWLPAAYEPVAIDLADTLVVRSSGTIVADAPSVSHLRYTVASALPALAGTVSPDQQAATDAPVPTDVRRYTALPKTTEISDIRAIARDVVTAAGATTPYAEAQALRDYFRGPDFVYDTNVDTVDNGSAILAFLRQKRGFCVQFASAYAVMARSLGIPARVAVGFTPGQPDAGGVYHVSNHDAHAWPEIYLTGLGWTHLFDPTPAAGGVITGGSNLPHDTPATATTPTTAPAATTQPTATTPAPGGSSNGQPQGTTPAPSAARPTVSTDSPGGGLGPWLPVVAALALVALVIGGYVGVVLVAKRRRRSRRRTTTDPVVAVTGAWAEALDRLHEAAVPANPALTPSELARVAPAGTNAAAGAPLRRLAHTYNAARYGDAVTGPDDAPRRVDVGRRARARTRR